MQEAFAPSGHLAVSGDVLVLTTQAGAEGEVLLA